MNQYLKTLTLKYFRSHKETILNFCSGVTVILGRSGSGKTNVQRGVKWLKDNRPLGLRFLSRFAGKGDKAEIKAEFTDVTVKFSKGKSGMSEYEIDGGEPFSGIANGVPDKVVEALNLSEVNVQKQLQLGGSPFLISDTPGEVARTINRITRMDRVDTWISSLTSRINTGTGEIRLYEGELRDKRERLEAVYAVLPEITLLVEAMEGLEGEISGIDRVELELGSVLDSHRKIMRRLKGDRKWLRGVEPLVEKAEKAEYELSETEDRIVVLESITEDWHSANGKKERAGRILGAEKLLTEAEGLREEIALIDEEYGILNEAVIDVKDKRGLLNGAKENLETIKTEYDELYKETIKSFSVCPGPLACNLNEDQIAQIMEG